MASVSNDPNGKRRILWTNGARKRCTLRLGKCTAKNAATVRLKVEAILAAQATGTPYDAEVTRWLAEISDTLHERLAATGLVAPREAREVVTLAELIRRALAAKNVKPATLTRMKQAEKALIDHFGADALARDITPAKAEDWYTALKKRYAGATASRTLKYAKQFYRWGVKRELVPRDPFDDLKPGSQTNAANLLFIDRDTIARVIDAAPSAEWRLLIALGRFGGLRMPGEGLALKWGDVNWSDNRLTIRSSKTERYEGGGTRFIPLFPELREPLQEVFDLAEEGSERVITSYRPNANIQTQLRRIVERAGVKPWPRIWHNLRASRQTELASEYPLHTVCAWIGNSKLVAQAHYLQQTDADWMRAVGGSAKGRARGAKCGAIGAQNAAQRRAAHNRAESHECSKTSGIKGETQRRASGRETARNVQMGPEGLEPSPRLRGSGF